MENNPHKGHRDRMRRRFETEGLASFEPHEVLELLLFHTVPRRDTNSIAHALIEKFGTLDKVFEAGLVSLTEVDGIGYNSAVLLKMIPQLSQYYMKERFDKSTRIDNVEQMGEYICSKIGLYDREVFAAAAFDARRSEISFRIISEGFVSETPVQLRALAEFAIEVRAEQLVIAHNHVAGEPTPSQADRDATKLICGRLYDIGIKVTDHIIVSGNRYFSFSANGILPV